MPWLDILLLLGSIRGYKKGRRRGAAEEAYKGLNALISLIAGAGCVGLLAGVLNKAGEAGGLSGPLVFIGGFGGAFIILRSFRKRLKAFTETRFGQRSASLGGLIGLIRQLIWTIAALFTAVLSPLSSLITPHSATGRYLAHLFQVE